MTITVTATDWLAAGVLAYGLICFTCGYWAGRK